MKELEISFKDLQKTCHSNAFKAGWWEGLNPNDGLVVATKLALVHSEISEALEGSRKLSKDDHLPHRSSIEVELGDAVIRILDLSGALGLDLVGAILEKLEYNKKRLDHKPEERIKEHGKRF